MTYIDICIHPVFTPKEADLFNVSFNSLEVFSTRIISEFEQHHIHHSMVCLFDSNPLNDFNNIQKFIELKQSRKLSFSCLIDFRDPSCQDVLVNAAKSGFSSITFHPYLQEIESTHFAQIADICQQAEKLGLFVCVCSAYGSKKIFKYYSLPLVVHLAERIQCPIVMIHGGGAKVLEAFLIAEMYPQIYFETSFSLPYWIGSTVETDFAFVMKSLGAHRCMFGSDAPFIPLDQAISSHFDFFKRHHFTDNDIDQIMGRTAAKLLGL
ncbi:MULTISPECIES: amidohydrolase family protein [unclassified Moorena]|uniref:amidohydrolase family protein n=1 Tax=unclassified Moorena TaxID=2683338 RepID=UPI0013FFAB7B|nr:MULTISPECIES: amidohydrolase family protein [unclassified Moorena]NEO12168.1 amidohydrolase family protein [Moorena sp. SIO3E8]NEQ00918.1 amidohydrolase family protein [Moorena sp. SIO3F7]